MPDDCKTFKKRSRIEIEAERILERGTVHVDLIRERAL